MLRNSLEHIFLLYARKTVGVENLQTRILTALCLCFYHTGRICELLFCTLSSYHHLVFGQVSLFLKILIRKEPVFGLSPKFTVLDQNV